MFEFHPEQYTHVRKMVQTCTNLREVSGFEEYPVTENYGHF